MVAPSGKGLRVGKLATRVVKRGASLSRAEKLLGRKGDIVVIGRQADTAAAKGWEGHVVLDVDDWSLKLNDEFIAAAIKEGRRVYLASPVKGNLVQTSGRFAGQPTVYARELTQLKEAGYVRRGDYLEPRR
jgi:hypothetical protein